MPNILEVQLKLTGGSSLVNNIMQAAKAVDRMQAQMDKLAASTRAAADAARDYALYMAIASRFPTPRIPGAGSTPATRTPPRYPSAPGVAPPVYSQMPQPPVYKQPQGPYAAYQRALQQHQNFPGSFDAAYQLQRASQALLSAQKYMATPPWLQNMQKMLGNVGMAGGFLRGAAGGGAGIGMVGNVGGLIGAFAEGGPIGIAIGAAVASLGIMAAGVHQATEALNEFRQAMIGGGGSIGETAQGRAIGNAMGMDVGSVAQMARQFNDRRSSDPMAAMFFGWTQPQPFRSTNDMKPFLRAVEHLAKLVDSGQLEEARRQARAGGIEGALNYAMLPKRTREELMGDAERSRGTFSAEYMRNAQEFSVQLSRVGDSISRIVTQTFAPYIPIATRMLDMLAGGINRMADKLRGVQSIVQPVFDLFGSIAERARSFAENHPALMRTLETMDSFIAKVAAFAATAPFRILLTVLDTLGKVFVWLADKVEAFLQKIGMGTDAKSKADEALKKHEDALRDNADATRGLQIEMQRMRAIFGGGERARGALPGGFRGPFLMQPGMAGAPAMFGAFNV